MFKDTFNNINRSNFTYKEFKFYFDEILDNVYKIKSEKLFLNTIDINKLEELLAKAENYKDLFYYYNKRKYYEKVKIYLYLLKLEINSIYLYD